MPENTLGGGAALDDLLKQVIADADEYAGIPAPTGKLVVVPVLWGGEDFARLRQLFHSKLPKTVTYLEETDRYDLFQWAYELQPTLGIFPLYLLPDRRPQWRVVPIGKQKRVSIAMIGDVAKRLGDRRLDPILEDKPNRHRCMSLMSFREFISELWSDARLNTRFWYFGAGHAAPRILAEVLEDAAVRQYFLAQLRYYRSSSKVVAARAAYVLEQLKDVIAGGAEGRVSTPDFRLGLTTASLSGLMGELAQHARGNDFAFVVSDLGVTEFQSLEAIARDLGVPLTIWDVEHEMEIPLGIGVSRPGVPWLRGQQSILKTIQEIMHEWFESVSAEDTLRKIEDEYGLTLEVPADLNVKAPTDQLDKIRKWLETEKANELTGGDGPLTQCALVPLDFVTREQAIKIIDLMTQYDRSKARGKAGLIACNAIKESLKAIIVGG